MYEMSAADICARLSDLAGRRSHFEEVWRQVADVAATDASEFMFGQFGAPDLGMHRASAAARSKNLYDGTAAWALDRLASGLEGLIMPQNEKWHGLAPSDLFSMNHKPSDEEVEWLEALTEFMFRVRYDSQSGFQTAMQIALRRLVGFGNGFLWVEEGMIGGPLIRYRHIPLNEIYVTEDVFGRVDGMFRVYQLTARQAVQKLKLGIWKTLPPTILADAQNPANAEKMHKFVHCVIPRTDFTDKVGAMAAPWRSVHVAYEDKATVGESGFFEFPLIDLRWLPEPGRVYGEGPVMRVLADVQSLNLMSKNELIASQQSIDPPLLVARAGVMNRADTNPGSIIVGGIDAAGRKMVEPLDLHQRVDLAQAVIQAKRQNLRESLYINLFANLQETQSRSATDALIKANEKGELLGPAGSRIQESLSRLVERELGILVRFGLLDQNSVFKAPRSLQGREIGPKFQSPLDRLRRAKEAEAVIRTLQIVAPIGQFDQSVWDNYDGDETVRGVADVLGQPRRFFRTQEEVQAIRQQRAAQQAAANQLAAAQATAEAAKNAAPALETLMGLSG